MDFVYILLLAKLLFFSLCFAQEKQKDWCNSDFSSLSGQIFTGMKMSETKLNFPNRDPGGVDLRTH